MIRFCHLYFTFLTLFFKLNLNIFLFPLQSERAQVISHLKAHGEENKQYRMKMDEKRKEMEPLQHALGQLRGSNFGGRDRRSGLCSSEEELNDVVSFNFNVFECSLYLLFLILEFIPFFFFLCY